MELDALTAVSPIDGRYRGKTASLAPYFSEYALMRYRLRVEIEYFIALCELPLPQLRDFPHSQFPALRDIYGQFSEADAARIKEIEQTTNHDVKAVEYFIKEQLDRMGGMEMPVKYVIEMFMDRIAASKTYRGKAYTDRDPLEYYERGAAKLGKMIHPETAALLHFLLKMLAEKGEQETFRYIRRNILK